MPFKMSEENLDGKTVLCPKLNITQKTMPSVVVLYNKQNAAKEIVEELVQTDITSRIKDIAVLGAPKPKAKKYDDVDLAQMSLFDTVKDDDVLKELKELDLGNLTPIEALNTLYQLQNKLKNRW